MALLHVEGFDGYADIDDLFAAYPFSYSSYVVYWTLFPTDGVLGGSALEIDDDNRHLAIRLPANTDTPGDYHVRFAFWVKLLDATSSADHAFIKVGTIDDEVVVHFILYMPEGVIEVNATESYASGVKTTTSLNDGEFHHVECYVQRSGTGENVKCWIDGTLEAELTSSAPHTSYQIPFVELRLNGAGAHPLYDDLVVWNDDGTDFTGHKGLMYVDSVVPVSDGSQTDWAPSTGTDQFAVVDEGPGGEGDTDEISTTTHGHITTFNFGDFSATSNEILAVALEARSKNDTGPNAKLQGRAVVNATGYDVGAEQIETQNFRNKQFFSTQNPDNSSPWTTGDINAAEFGFEAVHS